MCRGFLFVNLTGQNSNQILDNLKQIKKSDCDFNQKII